MAAGSELSSLQMSRLCERGDAAVLAVFASQQYTSARSNLRMHVIGKHALVLDHHISMMHKFGIDDTNAIRRRSNVPEKEIPPPIRSLPGTRQSYIVNEGQCISVSIKGADILKIASPAIYGRSSLTIDNETRIYAVPVICDVARIEMHSTILRHIRPAPPS
eukprot:6183326-Pleurochrysis_carterae.AAC.1